jgi:acyl transferase domain-containing protein
MASLSLRAGGCNSALVAGVKIILTPMLSAMFAKAGMLSPDGRCKTLDAAADGYVRGEAVAGMFLHAHQGGVVSSISVSHEDNLPSWAIAVILGSAVNQDGRSSSLTAPNGPAQQAVLRAALHDGRLEPMQLSHLQLHGTGTSLGAHDSMYKQHAQLLPYACHCQGHAPLALQATRSS